MSLLYLRVGINRKYCTKHQLGNSLWGSDAYSCSGGLIGGSLGATLAAYTAYMKMEDRD